MTTDHDTATATATDHEADEATLKNSNPFVQAAVLRVVLDAEDADSAAARFGLSEDEREMLPRLVEAARRMGVVLGRRHGRQA